MERLESNKKDKMAKEHMDGGMGEGQAMSVSEISSHISSHTPSVKDVASKKENSSSSPSSESRAFKKNETKHISVSIEPIKPKEFAQKGKLFKKDTLTLELEDIEQYLDEKNSMEHVDKNEHKSPFIIYLNSKFAQQVKQNQRIRKIRNIGFYLAIVLFVLILGFVLGLLLKGSK